MGRIGRKHIGDVGPWTFYEITGHGFSGDLAGKPLFDFEVDGARRVGGELYLSVDEAMVAAVAEKWTGPRGAGGSGVGTAADWFMAMIGADHGVTWAEQVEQEKGKRS